MSTGAKAGVGVGIAAAGVAIIGAVIFLLRRRLARKQTSELDENGESEGGFRKNVISAAPSSQSGLDNDGYVNYKDLPPMPMPAELSDERNSRSELGGNPHGPAAELESKIGRSETTERPADKT